MPSRQSIESHVFRRRVQRFLLASCMLAMIPPGAIAFAAGSQAPPQPAAAGPPKDWLAVLNAFVTHDDAAQRKVEDAANHAEDPNTRQLAAMLLTEWDFRSSAEALSRPRQVFMPKLPGDVLQGRPDGTIQTETFVFDITISREGLVSSAEIKQPPRQPALGDVAKARVLHALYRPVFDGREFVSFPAVVTSTIEVK